MRVVTTPSDRGDPPERERLIESHLPLVRSIARRYEGRGEPLEDLVQVGAIALVRASDRFDPERGVAFASFATPAIEGEIRRHLGDRSGSVRIPRDLRRMTGQLERSRAELAATLGRTPTLEELAAALGVEPEEAERALQAGRAREPSAEVSDEVAEAGADAQSLQSTEDRLALAAGSQVLDERERRIVLLRFHADMTEREIAREVGISQAQVSRLLTRALDKLREELDEDKLQEPGGDTTEARLISAEAPSAETKIPSVGALEEQAQTAGAAPAAPKVDLALPYQVTVKPAGEDPGSAWVAGFEELPGCEARGASPDQAVENLRAAMEAWLSAAVDEPRVISPPKRRSSRRKTGSSPSGRFLVRMPSQLHEELTLAAEREQISLNRFVTDRLAASVGSQAASAPGPPQPTETAPTGTSDRRRRLRVLVAANLAVIVLAAAAAVTLLVLALERGI